MISNKLLALAIFAAYLSYVIYQVPIPPGTSEPFKTRAVLVPVELVIRVANFLDFIGLVKDYKVMRWMESIKTPSPVEGIDTMNTDIDGVRVRVYKPTSVSKMSKAMVYFHGGGWVIASINTHDDVAAYFAKEADMIVVSVEYRLAPENTKNDGLEDCIKVTKYVIENAAKFGVDPERVVVAGDSAGGNYAAAVALYLRDQQFSPMPKLQLLIYPVVQGIDLELPSYQQNINGPLLTKQFMIWFFSYITSGTNRHIPYHRTNTHVPANIRLALSKGILSHDLLPNQLKYPPYEKPDFQHGGSEIWDKISKNYMDAYYFPLMAKDHSGLPETYMFTAQFDPLRDEGFLYVDKLRQDGVKVTHYNCPHGWHGMINQVNNLHDSTQIMKKMVNFINEQL